MADFSIKANDRKPSIRATLLTGTPPATAPVDLTNASRVDFIMKAGGVGGTVKVNSPAVIVDAPSGVVRYDWAAADTNAPGTYQAEWEVQWLDGMTQTFPTKTYHSIDVLADLDSAP